MAEQLISNTPYADTGVMSPTQATQIVQSAGIDPNAVLSSANIAQTINNPAPAPDDLLGIRAQIYGERGVDAAQAKLVADQKAASDALLAMNSRLTGLGNRAVSMSKITGSQAQERLVSQGEIDALNAAVANSLADYQLKKGSADEIFGIRNQELTEKKALMSQYPGAKIKPGDSFEQAMSKIDKYSEEAKKDLYKDELKKEARALGLKTSGSTKELEKRIGKASKQALVDAKKKTDLELEALRANIENTKKSTANIGAATADPLLDLKKQALENELKLSAQTIESNQRQLDDANKPGFWGSLWDWASN